METESTNHPTQQRNSKQAHVRKQIQNAERQEADKIQDITERIFLAYQEMCRVTRSLILQISV